MAQDCCKSYYFPHSLNRPESPVGLGSLDRKAETDKLRGPTGDKERSWLYFETFFICFSPSASGDHVNQTHSSV